MKHEKRIAYAAQIARRLVAALTCATGLVAGSFAAVTELRWSDSGTFAQTLSIAPGKVAEVCGMIDQKTSTAWKFNATAPVEFNIHRHAGNDVIYATRSFAVREQNGTFNPNGSYEWCWMWTNESSTPASVSVDLKRN
jgi:hypothetical protein